MKLKVRHVAVWGAGIDDRAGGLADQLSPLIEAGANFEFLIARRAPERPGRGVVFLTPLKGARQLRAAKQAGFLETVSLHSLRVEGPDHPGAVRKITRALADQSINLRGFSAAALGKRFVAYLALDNKEDAVKARRILSKPS